MTHLPWCDPSRCSPPVHEGGAEAHRSAPFYFGAHAGYLYQARNLNGPCPQFFMLHEGDASWSESGVAVADLQVLMGLIAELNSRSYAPPEMVAAAVLTPDAEVLPK